MILRSRLYLIIQLSTVWGVISRISHKLEATFAKLEDAMQYVVIAEAQLPMRGGERIH